MGLEVAGDVATIALAVLAVVVSVWVHRRERQLPYWIFTGFGVGGSAPEETTDEMIITITNAGWGRRSW